MADNPAVKVVLGGAAALQAVLTAVGASNGALVAIAINNSDLLIAAVALIIVAVLAGIALAVANPKSTDGWAIVVSIFGGLALLAGIIITGYIALSGPASTKTPDLDVAVSGSATTVSLTAEVKASGIPENSHYWVEVDARSYQASQNGGSYVQLGTPLYQAQLGSDSQGNIDTKIGLPVASKQYPAVSVEAWYGDHPGPCGSLTVAGGANLPKQAQAQAQQKAFLDQYSRPGCVVVRIPTASATHRADVVGRDGPR